MIWVFMSRQTRVRFLIFSYVIILICSFQSPYQSQTGYSIMPRVSSWLATKAILLNLGDSRHDWTACLTLVWRLEWTNQCNYIGENKKSDSCLATLENSDNSSSDYCATLFNLALNVSRWRKDTWKRCET